MKTIEEKAKAYDEALERAKQIRNGNPSSDTAIIVCEQIFHELRESKDERIRKRTIAILKQQRDFWSYDGPSEKFPPSTPRKDLVEAIDIALSYLERQKEHVPENEESGTRKEPKPRIEICPHSIKSKSYKENGSPIENCDYGLEIAYDILEKTFGEVRGYQTDDGIREHQAAIEAVRKAKEQKNAWSEEDEKNLDFVTDCVYEFYPDPVMKYKLKDWLKSLRPSWKPSEEQIHTLERICSNLHLRASDDAFELDKIIEQLKNL